MKLEIWQKNHVLARISHVIDILITEWGIQMQEIDVYTLPSKHIYKKCHKVVGVYFAHFWLKWTKIWLNMTMRDHLEAF